MANPTEQSWKEEKATGDSFIRQIYRSSTIPKWRHLPWSEEGSLKLRMDVQRHSESILGAFLKG